MQLIFIGTILFLFKTGIMLLDTTVRPYLLDAVCKMHLYGNETLCLNLHNYPEHKDSVQKEASIYFFIYQIAANVPAFVTCPLLGAWSDKNGRRLSMIFSCIGLTLSVPFYIGSMYIGHPTLAVWIILAGTFFQGLSGKVISMTVNCFIVEISDAKNITKHMSMLSSMNFFGNCFGAFLAGIIGWKLVPYFTVIGINCVTVIIILVFIKETKHRTTGKVSDSSEISKSCADCESSSKSATRNILSDNNADKHPLIYGTFERFKTYFDVFTRKRTGFINICIIILLSIIFVCGCDTTGDTDVLFLFVSRSPYNWEKSLYSYFVSFHYISQGVSLLVILSFLSKILKLSDIYLVMIGLSCRVIRYACLGLGFSTETWTIFVYDVIGSGGSFIICIKSIVSKIIGEEDLGKFFAIYAIIEIAAKLIGSIAYLGLYRETVSLYPGITFFVMGLVNFALLIVTVVVSRLFKKGQNKKVTLISFIKLSENGKTHI